MNRRDKGKAQGLESRALEFVSRPVCEICAGEGSEDICNMALDAGPVAAFLTKYYRGRVDPRTLALGRYIVRRCSACGFVWQSQVLADAGLRELYEIWIDVDESRAKSDQRDLRQRLRPLSQIAFAMTVIGWRAAERRALDFGMGWGGWCECARAIGFRVSGAELSPTRIAHGRELGIEVLDDLPIPGRQFDLINSEQVFEHVVDPVPVLRMLADHLAPAGLLRISVPNVSSALGAMRNGNWVPGKDAIHPLEHVNGFDHRSLIAFGATAGLAPLGTRTVLTALLSSALQAGGVFPGALAEIANNHIRGTAIWFHRPGDGS